DFINVRDVVQANLKAAQAHGVSGAFNLGSASRVTINELVELVGKAGGIEPKDQHGAPRPGDVRHSLADISAAREAFGFEPSVGLEEGIVEYMKWAKEEVARS
ncbi:epimerase, partial [bacterium]|nr:epimerase [bacterium]